MFLIPHQINKDIWRRILEPKPLNLPPFCSKLRDTPSFGSHSVHPYLLLPINHLTHIL